MRLLSSLLAGCTLILCAPVPLTAGEAAAPDPAAYRAFLQTNPNLDKIPGEAFTWHAANGLGRFVAAWQTYRDPRWLDEAALHFDWLIGRMAVEPDGYPGWVGPRMGTTDGLHTGPHVVGDANLIEPMLAFAEAVLNDPAQQVRLGAKARDYLALARRVVEKWDRRGSYAVDGEFAVYTQQDLWQVKDAPGRLTRVPELKITENMNKSGKMGVVMLRLHRLTGEAEWRTRAVRLFSQYKRIMRLLPDEKRMIFNFWEPFGPWDLDPATGHPRGWINVHPFRPGYQAAEIGMMVAAYHDGIVFTRHDIELLIATNLWMWNKSLDDPQFVASDGRSKAGTLWAALADFDPTIRELRRRQLAAAGDEPGARIDRDHFEHVTAKLPPGFARRNVADEKDCILPDIPLHDSRELNFAAAIPGTLTAGETVFLASQVRGKGTLRLTLHAADGGEIALLHRQEVDGSTDFDGRAGFTTLTWDGRADGAAVAPGTYTVRWTLNGSRRERALVIR